MNVNLQNCFVADSKITLTIRIIVILFFFFIVNNSHSDDPESCFFFSPVGECCIQHIVMESARHIPLSVLRPTNV